MPSTYTDAKILENKLLQGLIEGRYEIIKNKKNPLFKDYADEYEESVTWQKSHERTSFSIVKLKKYFGKKRLTEITVSDIISYRSERLKTVKQATINREHACLKRMLTIVVESDEYQINKNPASRVKMFKETQAEDRTLALAEYYKLLEVAPEYFRKVIIFACNTAMRRSEILNLKFGQIKIWPNGAEIELVDTKSGEKENVPLNEEAEGLVFEIARERNIDLKNLSQKQKSEHVFLGRYGRHMKDIRKQMQITFQKAGIEYRPFHTFRHFWTSEMFNAGVDVGKIRKIGRWRDLKTMLRYCHSNKSEERDAVNALSSHLRRRPATVLKINQR